MTLSTGVQSQKPRREAADQDELQSLLNPEKSLDPALFSVYARKLRQRGWAGQRSASEKAYLKARG